MKVRLVAVTAPLPETGMTSPAELIAYCARVSNPKNQERHETAGRLLRYLASHGHWSPFEMVSMLIEIETTRDIARQVLRHRSFSFQEFSLRYAEGDFAEPREARLQDVHNRQSSLETDDEALKDWWEETQAEHVRLSAWRYQEALRRGVAKEVARALLPEGLTRSRLYVHGTLRSWIHYCRVRTGPDTQKEHRLIAIACRDILLARFPDLRVLFDEEVKDGEKTTA